MKVNQIFPTILLFALVLLFLALQVECQKKREKRSLIYTSTSLYGVFLAIAVPVDIPDRNVFVSYNFESNYAPISNITQITDVYFPNAPIASRTARSLTRGLTYKILESKFKELGMTGKPCLLKNICETSEMPLHHNGVLGHLLHIIFTPSTSQDENIDSSFYEAEMRGKHGDCTYYEKACPFSLFDAISKITELRSI